MNRRGFLARLATGLAGFTILPGAGRVWKAERVVVVPPPPSPVLVPFWFQTRRLQLGQSDEYTAAIEKLVKNFPDYPRMISQ